MVDSLYANSLDFIRPSLDMFIVKVFAHGQALFVDVSPLACVFFFN